MLSVRSECNDSNALATIRVLVIRFSTKFDARRFSHRPWGPCLAAGYGLPVSVAPEFVAANEGCEKWEES